MRPVGWIVGTMVLSIIPSFQLSAQHFSVGPQVVFGDYREVSSDLRYNGGGIGAKATLEWKKFSADIVLSKVKYKPDSHGTFSWSNGSRLYYANLAHNFGGTRQDQTFKGFEAIYVSRTDNVAAALVTEPAEFITTTV